MVADMEVDKVADMVADMEVDKMADIVICFGISRWFFLDFLVKDFGFFGEFLESV